MRREGFRRPELLPPHAHGIEAAVIGESMAMHDMQGHGMDDVQVGAAPRTLRKTLSSMDGGGGLNSKTTS